jgi:NAD(P)-dependent dehydrogenase (short-subunit alcohol dehydrogenase family)
MLLSDKIILVSGGTQGVGAGIARAASREGAVVDEYIAINLKAPFFLMQTTVTDMVRRGRPGSIVNVITMSAHGGQPYLPPYVASKAGLIGPTKNAAHAHRWDKIRINGHRLDHRLGPERPWRP